MPGSQHEATDSAASPGGSAAVEPPAAEAGVRRGCRRAARAPPTRGKEGKVREGMMGCDGGRCRCVVREGGRYRRLPRNTYDAGGVAHLGYLPYTEETLATK